MADNYGDITQAQKTVQDHVIEGLQAAGFSKDQATALVKYFAGVITSGVPPAPPGGGGGD